MHVIEPEWPNCAYSYVNPLDRGSANIGRILATSLVDHWPHPIVACRVRWEDRRISLIAKDLLSGISNDSFKLIVRWRCKTIASAIESMTEDALTA